MDFETGWTERRAQKKGLFLRELRLERGVSQNQLADEAGVNVSQVSRVEAGRDARLSTWLKLFRGLGYELRFEIQETAEDVGGLLADESWRRQERRAAGLLMGKGWR